MTSTRLRATSITLQVPLISVLMLVFAVSALLALRHEPIAARPSYAVTSDARLSRATPYGSGAALRDLLF